MQVFATYPNAAMVCDTQSSLILSTTHILQQNGTIAMVMQHTKTSLDFTYIAYFFGRFDIC